jgi:hypothetical protein
MTTLLVPWLLFPAVLGLVSFGCGLLLERVSGKLLHGGLLLPAGLAVVIVLGGFTTAFSQTATLTVPVVLAASVAGFALSIGRRFGRDLAPVALALATFAVYAAPVVLTGAASFTGYVKLDDTASFLGFTDQIMSHGRDFSALAPSTFQRLLYFNIREGYPVGAFVPLGIGSRLVGQDPAWTFQPCMAFYAAAASLGLFALLRGTIMSSWLRAGMAFVAGQAALLYAYALWGGIKEVAAAATIALAAALVPVSREELGRWRELLPFATAAAATFGVLSVTGVLWIGLLTIPALVLIARSPGRFWRPAAIGVGAVALLAIPSLLIAHRFVHYTTSNLLTQSERLGNLIRSLRLVQIFGIWPTGDFRYDPGDLTATRILVAVCAGSAIWGAVYAARRRTWRPALVAIACGIAALILQVQSSPWLVAKALATGSPFVVLLGLTGGAALLQSGRRIEGAVLAGAITAGVLWSNVLGYSAAWIAPRGQLRELEEIGRIYQGQGPALMTEYQPYGVRHFLRKLDAEGASELRANLVPLVDGSSLAPGATADLDRFRYPDILFYRTLVLRTSPVESRPAAPYNLVFGGRYYDVWQRPATGGPQVILHVPLGNDIVPSSIPDCRLVKSLAAQARSEGAVLAVARTPNPVVVPLAGAAFPAGWYSDPSRPQTVTPTGPGTVTTTANVPSAGNWSVWLDGFLLRNVRISIDGRYVGTIDQYGELEHPVGTIALGPGSHTIALRYGDAWWRPGATSPGREQEGRVALGPLTLAPVTGVNVVDYVQPDEATSLCGRTLDWIEIVKRAASS